MLGQPLAILPRRCSDRHQQFKFLHPCLTGHASMRFVWLPYVPQELLLYSNGHNWTRANAFQTEVHCLLLPCTALLGPH